MTYLCEATKEELKEGKRKCWNSGCPKTAHFEVVGWRYCFKHWKQDYKYGMGHGLWNAIRWTRIVNFLKIK